MTTKASDNLQFIKWPTKNVLAITTTRLPANHYHSAECSAALNSTASSNMPLPTAFDFFNVGDHVGDCVNKVAANRKSLLEHLPKKTKIQWLKQVHGNDIVNIELHNNIAVVADAAITRSRDIALAIMTADCLPILLSNNDGSEIAAIHAGWRPLSKNIIVNTLAKMITNNEEIHAWLGPCIGQTHFEVGVEVKQVFVDISPKLSDFFLINSNNKYQADLAGLATYLLKLSGVGSIVHHKECTFAQQDKYYSYRREQKTGRMASIICFN